MHELAITQSILNIALSEAEKYNSPRILSINIRIGEFAGVVPALIQDYFSLISKGTPAEEAKLVLERVPVKIRCLDCEEEHVIDRAHVRCPNCGSIRFKMLSGREFYVESLEVSE